MTVPGNTKKDPNRRKNMNWDKVIDRKKCLESARNAAEYIYRSQNCQGQAYGYLPSGIESERYIEYKPAQWTIAFGSMALLAASSAFQEERFRKASLLAAEYIKSLQVFSPFLKEDYGAFNESGPHTNWCYTRDSVSAAWSFLVLYKATHNEEYLERARLFAEWFVRRTLDPDGWPVSRVFFTREAHDAITSRPGGENIDEFANVQGYFQGGGLNFFKLLAETSGDGKWVSEMYLRMADLLVDRMQEPCGNYNSVKIATKEFNPPKYVRDDFCSLGLIGAYKLTKNPKYIQSVEKYLRYAFSIQLPDGSFKDDDSIASIPEILNAAYEAEGLMDTSFISEDAVKSAFDFLFKRQYDGWLYRKMAGGFIEETFVDINSWPPPVFTIHLRGTSYATLFLLKMATGKAVGIEA